MFNPKLASATVAPQIAPTVALGDKERQILYLYFWEELQQADIAARLKIPLGTVKSHLHTAKQKFKEHYPYSSNLSKGVSIMKSLP